MCQVISTISSGFPTAMNVTDYIGLQIHEDFGMLSDDNGYNGVIYNMMLLGGSGLPWLCLDPNEGLHNAKTMERRYSSTYLTILYHTKVFLNIPYQTVPKYSVTMWNHILDLPPFLPKKNMKTCTPHNCINCQMSKKRYALSIAVRFSLIFT